jgi:zinc finger BED domain-containing protein 1 (E3 SUMO-protein ligase ZBED1)
VSFAILTRETTNQELRQAILDLIIQCNLPIRVVNSTAFQKLIKLTRAPGAINRDIIGQEITNTYQNKKVEIQSILTYHRDNGTKFILYIDCWTSKSQHAFLGISIHFINSQWQQESFLLALADLRRRHKGIYLYKTLNKVLTEFGIGQSILAVIRDNASNNITLMNAFQE